MRSSSTFIQFTVVLLAAVLVAFVAFGGAAVEAAQATPEATTMATGAATTYPPCPPTGVVGTPVATEAASMAATSAATPNANPAYLGVTAEQVDSCGVRVVDVRAGSPASQAKLQPDDIIVALDGQAMPDINLLRDEIRMHAPGDKVTLTVERGTQQLDLSVTLGAVPADTTGTVEAATPAATQ